MDNKNRVRRHADVLRAEIDGKDFHVTNEKIIVLAKSKEGFRYRIGYVYFKEIDSGKIFKLNEIDL